MKKSISLTWLVPIIVILSAILAIVGLITANDGFVYSFTNVHGQTIQMDGRGIYKYDSLLAAAGFRGTNAVMLLFAIPLLVIAYIAYLKGSIKGGILLLGALLPFLYCGASMTFSAAFSDLFLGYTALLSTSFFATITVISSINLQLVDKRIKPGFPYKGIGIILIIAGFGTLFIWMSELLPALFSGSVPETLGPYTTMFTHGFDSAIISPAFILIGIYSLKHKPLGVVLAAPFLILCVLVGFFVIGQSIAQYLAGLIFPINVYIGLVGSWVLLGVIAIGFTITYFRNIQD
ncbi:hypothetical protein JR338_05730 [Chloroflexota bacterium]|nr:hypothetical protein JR338_05730 [Chloroflexota bacterium]